ncbi:MAG TPA: hypothetical protein VF529_06100 [Solirubrobacteraceae bacterium]
MRDALRSIDMAADAAREEADLMRQAAKDARRFASRARRAVPTPRVKGNGGQRAAMQDHPPEPPPPASTNGEVGRVVVLSDARSQR